MRPETLIGEEVFLPEASIVLTLTVCSGAKKRAFGRKARFSMLSTREKPSE